MRQLSMKFSRDCVAHPEPAADVRIRTFAPGDEEALKDALVSLTLHRYDDAELDRDILERAGVIPQGVFLAELAGMPVGTATGYITPKTGKGMLHMVSVLPEASGRRLGEILCGRAVAFMLAHGVKLIDLTTDDPRLPAIKIYLRLGFLPVADDAEMCGRWQDVLDNLQIGSVAAYESLQSAEPTLTIKGGKAHG